MIYADIVTNLGTGKTVAHNIKENQDIEEDQDPTLALHLQVIDISKVTNNSEKKEEIEEDLLHLTVRALQTLLAQAHHEGNIVLI